MNFSRTLATNSGMFAMLVFASALIHQCDATGMLGEQCSPVEWGTNVELCPVADCTKAPPGCHYAVDHYVVNTELECCPKLCYTVDSNGKECTFVRDETSRRMEETCKPTGVEPCPVAKCAAPPAGCDYVFDHFVVNELGDCCASLCYAVDSNGALCDIDSLTTAENATAVSQQCEPTGEEICPVARCTAPPAGCDYVFDHFVVNELGDCCASLCYAVDINGTECRFDSVSFSENATAVGDQCQPTGKESCAVARCTAPPAGCDYVFDHYVFTELGVCCARQCYAVDSNGIECGVDSGSTSENATVVGEQCKPTGEEICPVARCTAPPAGCDYVFDHYVVNELGVCCAIQCYAVDINGTECRIDSESTSENATVVVGEQCKPSGEELCPVASCSGPPAGCDYVLDHYVVNELGDCCARLCYAVDSTGNECALDSVLKIENTTMVGEQCKPTGKEPCPVAKCAAPPTGCDYVFDHFVVNELGDCCARLCYAVDINGTECGVDSMSTSENTVAVGEQCEPTGDEPCPVAKCAKPSAGCDYVFDHFVVTELGDCCASLCYAVDSNGTECDSDAFVDNMNATKVGEQCDQDQMGTAPEMCPVAACGEPPAGCEYVFDHFVINTEGDCCASLCYAVDGSGNECTGSGGSSGATGMSGGSDSSNAYVLVHRWASWMGVLAAIVLACN